MSRQLIRAIPVAMLTASLVTMQANPACAQQPDAKSLDGAAVHVYKTVGDVELKLYVFEPEGASNEPRPGIVFFFGGGWRSGSPTQFAPHARYLASRGMIACCAEYRVHSKHGVNVAECVADAKSAMRWLRMHAEELGLDPQRLAAGGGSAGGHLAAAVAILDGFNAPGEPVDVSCRPDALALFNPALDLTDLGGSRQANEERRERFGASPEELSPGLHVIPGLPPTIVFHGEADTTVPIAQIERFQKKMEQCGNTCVLMKYPEAQHGFFNHGRDDNAAFKKTLTQLDEFLGGIGYLDGPPQPDLVPAASPANRRRASRPSRM